MKIVDRLLHTLCAIDKDKYQHFVLGGVIQTVTFIVTLLIACLLSTFENAVWFSIIEAFIFVLTIELYKEFLIDDAPDAVDILVTVTGALFATLSTIVVLCLI